MQSTLHQCRTDERHHPHSIHLKDGSSLLLPLRQQLLLYRLRSQQVPSKTRPTCEAVLARSAVFRAAAYAVYHCVCSDGRGYYRRPRGDTKEERCTFLLLSISNSAPLRAAAHGGGAAAAPALDRCDPEPRAHLRHHQNDDDRHGSLRHLQMLEHDAERHVGRIDIERERPVGQCTSSN